MRGVLVLLTGIALSPAAAALEKCTSADGKVTYSDRGCAPGAKRASLGGGASTANVAMEYYDVPGPGGHQGTAHWQVGYKFSAKNTRDGCAVDKVETDVKLRIRMPRWTPGANASSALVSKWQAYLAALEVHERGHLQHGLDLESAFLGAARALRAESCAALGALLKARYETLYEQARQRDVDYDRQTRHGATQGAYFQF